MSCKFAQHQFWQWQQSTKLHLVPANSTVLLQPTQCTLQVCPLSVAISYTIEMGHSSGGRDYIITCVVSTRLICKPTKQTDML